MVFELFILMLFGMVVIVSLLLVCGGWVMVFGYVVDIGIVLLFFFYGVKLLCDVIWVGMWNWWLYLVVLVMMFVVFLIMGLVISNLLFVIGLLVVGLLFVMLLLFIV